VARYAVLRIAKVKTMGHVAGLGLHVERERETRNADEARRQENERRAQEREMARQRVQERQRDGGRDRGGWDHDR